MLFLSGKVLSVILDVISLMLRNKIFSLRNFSFGWIKGYISSISRLAGFKKTFFFSQKIAIILRKKTEKNWLNGVSTSDWIICIFTSSFLKLFVYWTNFTLGQIIWEKISSTNLPFHNISITCLMLLFIISSWMIFDVVWKTILWMRVVLFRLLIDIRIIDWTKNDIIRLPSR